MPPIPGPTEATLSSGGVEARVVSEKSSLLVDRQGGNSAQDHSPQRKRKSVVKSEGGKVTLVVGKDINISQIMKLEGCLLVGKFYGRRFTINFIFGWIEKF